MSPQRELTHKRPTNYSTWHRAKLPDWCYHTDGDWFEQRLVDEKLVEVGYIETIEVPPLFVNNAQHEYELWPSKEALIKEIRQKMRIPCFVVRHTPGCDLFSVARFTASGEAEAIIMNENQYKSFIINLGKQEL